MNGRPAITPASNTVQMFGCCRAAADRASRTNRWARCGASDSPKNGILRATWRSSFVSRARYTAPIPPRPRSFSTRYRPNSAGSDGNGSPGPRLRVVSSEPSMVGLATNAWPHFGHVTVRPLTASPAVHMTPHPGAGHWTRMAMAVLGQVKWNAPATDHPESDGFAGAAFRRLRL